MAFITATEFAALLLRRYVSWDIDPCPIPGNYGFHNAETYIRDLPIKRLSKDCWIVDDLDFSHDDPRWPTHCACGHAFAAADPWQEFHERLFTDGVRFFPHHALPPGAILVPENEPELLCLI